MFGPMAKWVAQIDEVERIPELRRARLPRRDLGAAGAGRARAARRTCSSRRPTSPTPRPTGRPRRTRARPTSRGCGSCSQGATRPLVIVGGQPWSAAAHDELAAWCEASELPIAASFRCQDYVDNASPVYAGHLGIGQDPRLAARVRDADVLLVVGDRLGEITTARLHAPRRRRARGRRSSTSTRIRDELARVYQPELAIAVGPRRSSRRRLRDVPPLDGVGVARGDGAGARRVPREPPATRRSPATSTSAR